MELLESALKALSARPGDPTSPQVREIGVGIMAYLGVLYETGNHLLAGLAFSAGLIALPLAKSELFTEGFLVPIAAVVAREASYAQLGKLWGGTLVANLVGGWLFMALIMTAFPQWSEIITKEAAHYLDAGFNWKTVCLAVLAGSTITLMTRMQHGTDSVTGKDRGRRRGRFPALRAAALPLDPGLAADFRCDPHGCRY